MVFEVVQPDEFHGPGHAAPTGLLCRHENVQVRSLAIADVVNEVDVLAEVLCVAFEHAVHKDP